MRQLILIIMFFLAISCFNKRNDPRNAIETRYQVYKIDSLNNYYLIYLKRNDSLFKVVSQKQTTVTKNEPIRVNRLYYLTLAPMMRLIIQGKDFTPMNYLDVQCYQFDSNTTICNEIDIQGLFFTKDIKGLHYSITR